MDIIENISKGNHHDNQSARNITATRTAKDEVSNAYGKPLGALRLRIAAL